LDPDVLRQNAGYTVQVIVGNDPDIILVPVNKSQKTKALRNLPRTLKVISQLSKPGFDPKVIVVPLGISKDSVAQVVERIDQDNQPNQCEIASEMPDLQELMQIALYEDRKYIWEYENYEYLFEYFCTILEI
jgi:chromosome partitioning protein